MAPSDIDIYREINNTLLQTLLLDLTFMTEPLFNFISMYTILVYILCESVVTILSTIGDVTIT